MGYDIALSNAWHELGKITKAKNYSVKFLADNYNIDVEKKQILSVSYNAPAKDYIGILILHYLAKKLKGMPTLQSEWISFKELTGGEGYYPTFKKRVIDIIMRKYSPKPENLFELIERFTAKKTQLADISVVLDTFNDVPVLLTFWRGDEELGSEANILFDKNISNIFCTEDIIVLSEIVAHSI